MYKIFINGYFTKEHINGVPRYAMEMVKRLDGFLKPGVAVLVVPKGANNIPTLKNIHILTWEERGKKPEISNALWGELVYGKLVNRGALNINFSNRAEKISNSLTAIHDVLSLKRYRYEFNLQVADRVRIFIYDILNLLWLKHRFKIKKQFSKKIITVSEHSKNEIVKVLDIPADKIEVIGNGWEHILDIVPVDEQQDDRIHKRDYYFTIANLKPHKNVHWVIEMARKNPDQVFVIAGKIPQYITTNLEFCKNVVFLGYISDSYMRFLMENAKALIFPSYEEGFGIPPLEALALGTPAIVSDIPVMHEIFEDCVSYINPNDTNGQLPNVIEVTGNNKVNDLLMNHSWENESKKWLMLIKRYESESVISDAAY